MEGGTKKIKKITYVPYQGTDPQGANNENIYAMGNKFKIPLTPPQNNNNNKTNKNTRPPKNNNNQPQQKQKTTTQHPLTVRMVEQTTLC